VCNRACALLAVGCLEFDFRADLWRIALCEQAGA